MIQENVRQNATRVKDVEAENEHLVAQYQDIAQTAVEKDCEILKL